MYPFHEIRAAWFWEAFWFVWGTLFYFFSFISACLMVSISSYLYFFSSNILILSCFGSSIPSIVCLFPLFFLTMSHFSIANAIPIYWLYILIICIRLSDSFSFFCKELDAVHVHKVINLFLELNKNSYWNNLFVVKRHRYLTYWIENIKWKWFSYCVNQLSRLISYCLIHLVKVNRSTSLGWIERRIVNKDKESEIVDNPIVD